MIDNLFSLYFKMYVLPQPTDIQGYYYFNTPIEGLTCVNEKKERRKNRADDKKT